VSVTGAALVLSAYADCLPVVEIALGKALTIAPESAIRIVPVGTPVVAFVFAIALVCLPVMHALMWMILSVTVSVYSFEVQLGEAAPLPMSVSRIELGLELLSMPLFAADLVIQREMKKVLLSAIRLEFELELQLEPFPPLPACAQFPWRWTGVSALHRTEGYLVIWTTEFHPIQLVEHLGGHRLPPQGYVDDHVDRPPAILMVITQD
jgi:hypothetical protein